MPAKNTSPHPVDLHVGTQLKSRRTILGMSQHKLAEIVDITFQQIQKYERGANRISASRLFQISRALDVPISYFFDNFGDNSFNKKILACSMSDNDQELYQGEDNPDGDDLINNRETLKLLKQYYSIKDPKIRNDIYTMVRNMASTLKDS
jgi:transcriptional regulator with XRE-family HTH domain